MSIASEQQPRVYTIRQYRMTAKVLHWVTAALVFAMFASGVIAKQLGGGALADALMSLHKITGVTTLLIVIARLVYRATRSMPEWRVYAYRRPLLHWTLYVVVLLVPLLGWAGISDFGAREVLPGYSLPPIWPEGAGYDGILLQYHAYMAFALLALVALHIGIAMQDYMTDRHPDGE
jgi:cytochrome b561